MDFCFPNLKVQNFLWSEILYGRGGGIQKIINAVLYGEFENEKIRDTKFLTFWSGDLNPKFAVIFKPLIWIWEWPDTKFLTFWSGDLNPKFAVIFEPLIWIWEWPDQTRATFYKRDMTFSINLFFKLSKPLLPLCTAVLVTRHRRPLWAAFPPFLARRDETNY